MSFCKKPAIRQCVKERIYSEQQKLSLCNKGGNYATDFGYAVAVSADSDIIVVGAPKYNVDAVSGAGAVFIYQRNLSLKDTACSSLAGFVLRQTLTASEPDDDDVGGDKRNFGTAVAVSGDGNTIIVGAPFQSSGSGVQNLDSGQVFVFRRAPSTVVWKLTQVIVAQQRTSETDCTIIADQDAKRGFGEILALSRNGCVLAIGDPQAVADQKTGLGYVYESRGTIAQGLCAANEQTQFLFCQRITLAQVMADVGVSTPNLAIIATALAINGDGTVIALSGATEGQICTGRVFIYRRLATPTQNCCIYYQFAQSLGDPVNFFGCALALTPDAEYLAVETSSDVRVYRNSCTRATSWLQFVLETALSSPIAMNLLQFKQRSIAISDDGSIVAAGFEKTSALSVTAAGNVSVFEKTLLANGNSTWTLRQDIFEKPAPRDGTHYGSSVALSGNGTTLVIGAPFATDLVNIVDVYHD